MDDAQDKEEPRAEMPIDLAYDIAKAQLERMHLTYDALVKKAGFFAAVTALLLPLSGASTSKLLKLATEGAVQVLVPASIWCLAGLAVPFIALVMLVASMSVTAVRTDPELSWLTERLNKGTSETQLKKQLYANWCDAVAEWKPKLKQKARLIRYGTYCTMGAALFTFINQLVLMFGGKS